MNAIVVDAEGTYGDELTVWFTGDIEQCKKYAKRGQCQVIAGASKSKGDKIKRGILADMLTSGHWHRVAK